MSNEFGSESMFRWMNERVVTLSYQGGTKVLLFDDECVLKVGDRVLPSEEAAIRLVKEHTDVPVPEVYLATYTASEGRLAMSVIPGTPLNDVWDTLDITQRGTSVLSFGLWFRSSGLSPNPQTCNTTSSVLPMARPASRIRWSQDLILRILLMALARR